MRRVGEVLHASRLVLQDRQGHLVHHSPAAVRSPEIRDQVARMAIQREGVLGTGWGRAVLEGSGSGGEGQ